MSSNREYCLVPMCDSTTTKNPQKLFFAVPSEEPDRSRWFNAMRRDLKNKPLSSKAKFRVCEDHFDLDKDVLNIGMVRFSIENGYRRPPAQYRPGLVPHKFACQSSARLLTGKRRKLPDETSTTPMIEDPPSCTSHVEEDSPINLDLNENSDDSLTLMAILLLKVNQTLENEDYKFCQFLYHEMQFLPPDVKKYLQKSIQRLLIENIDRSKTIPQSSPQF